VKIFGRAVSSLAAGVAIFFFFIPWVMVSCGEEELWRLSGWQLSAGFSTDLGFEEEDYEEAGDYEEERYQGDIVLFAALLAPIGILVVVLLTRNHYQTGNIDGYSFIGLGALALAIVYIKIRQLPGDPFFEDLEIQPLYGYWVTLSSHIAAVGGGVIKLLGKTSVDGKKTETPEAER
jgi:hypothetical protein